MATKRNAQKIELKLTELFTRSVRSSKIDP